MKPLSTFAQRRRTILASLVALPSTFIAGLLFARQRPLNKEKISPPAGKISVKLHPQAVARTKRRASKDR